MKALIFQRLVLKALLAAGLLLPGAALHATSSDAGTSGATFLKIGAGARAVGMGEAFTAVADDVNTVAWNPAGLGRLSSAEFTAMHAQWLQDTDYEFAAGAYPTPWGTLAFGFRTLQVDDIPKRLTDVDTPDGSFDASDALYSLGYGRGVGDNWWLGANVGYIRQSINSVNAGALTGDLGALWHTPHRPLTLGLAIRHLGPELKFVDEGDPQPLVVSAGAAYKLFKDRLTLSTDLRLPNDNDLQYAFGTEYSQDFFWELGGSLRLGYNSAGTDPTDGLTGVSLGFGLAWRTRFHFDMAWVPFGDLGNTFRYAFLFKF